MRGMTFHFNLSDFKQMVESCPLTF